MVEALLLLLGALFLWLIAFFIRSRYQRLQIYRKNLRHLNNAPKFSPAALACYMRFSGRLVATEQYISPLFKQPCSFYWAAIVANWKTKQKKPGKGWDTHRKRIFHTASAPFLLLQDSTDRVVAVDIEAFLTAGIVQLNMEQAETTRCPQLASAQDEERYQDYALQEFILEQQDKLTVYGLLMPAKTAPFLTLIPTGVQEYVSFIYHSQHKADLQTLKRQIKTKLTIQISLIMLGLIIFFYVAYWLINLLFA
jgi:hypothetical protein